MPSIGGNLSYATGRYNGITGLTGIPNIPIVIQNTASGVGIGVFTDNLGNYTVNAVPAGSYRIVEAYGFVGAVSSPATFPVTTIPVPTPKDPPLGSIAAPIAGTNTVDSLTPNTILVTMASTTITGQNFRDSSLKVNPLSLPVGTSFGSNLLTLAGNGIWGTLPAGSFANITPATYPYANSMTSSLLKYTNSVASLAPLDANWFSMSNINSVLWFYAPNHTTFDETSSYLLVNGGDPNALLFSQTMNVTPNTFYLASAWVMMITNLPNTCLIGFKVLAQDGITVLFYGQTSNILYGEWSQLGQLFNSGNNNQVTVQVISNSTASNGNDFALDDVQLQLVSFDGNVTLQKSLDKSLVTVGSTIKYTSVVTTNINLFNVIFQDTIPFGTAFTAGTVNINNTNFPSYNPITGFTLPSLSAGSTSTITFNVHVTTGPSSGKLDNVSNFTYSASIIAGNTITNTVTSNTVSSAVQFSRLDSIKAVDRAYCTVGDTLVYTVTLVNAGNVTAGTVVFQDTIPNGTTFVPNSLSFNGVVLTGSNPQSSISLGTMPVGVISTISFKVVVNTIPSPNPIPNSSTTSYIYLVDPTISFYPTDTSTSNIVNTKVNLVLIDSKKYVDYLYGDVGTTLTYTIPINNYGTTIARSIIFIDTIPVGTSLVANSLKQDGVVISGLPNPPGVNLSNINPNTTSTITFQVTVTTLPTTGLVQNIATTNYTYIVDPSTTPIVQVTAVTNTNTTLTTITAANLSNITKSVDKSWTDTNTTINYTLSMSNTGNGTATNVILIDTIPIGTNFVTGSVAVNGVTSVTANPSPPGINLGSIGPNIRTTVTFSVVVSSTAPYPTSLSNVAQTLYNIGTSITSAQSNTVSTTLSTAKIYTSKSVDKAYANLGDVLSYTIPITNYGTTVARSIVFIDTIPQDTSFVSNSLKQDGTVIPGSPNNPGVSLSNIEPNTTSTITFQVTVSTLPTTGFVQNISTTRYTYVVNPATTPVITDSATINSNIAYTTINNANFKNITKSVDKSYAICGEILTYTITLPNSGNVTAVNVIFTDTIPNGTSLVPNSVTVDDTTIPSANPQTGINVGTISAGASSVIIFSVQVNC